MQVWSCERDLWTGYHRTGVCAGGREVVLAVGLEGGLDPGERGLKALESPRWKKSTTRQSLISDCVH